MLKIILTAALMAISPRMVQAHDHSRPDLDKWFEGLHSQFTLKDGSRVQCCDGTDAIRVDEGDWDAECVDGICHYKVKFDGEWAVVPDHAVVLSPNRAGTALLWAYYWVAKGDDKGWVAIRCFMPGTGF